MSVPIRVVVWNEFRHERRNPAVARIYPDGLHRAIGAPLAAQPDLAVRYATLDEPDHGLPDDVLQATDVLIWWGHCAHREVRDDIAASVQRRVHEGMGLIVLHSGHLSKVFRGLLGTPCTLRWREAAEKERLWVVEPAHPIAEGIGPYFEIPHAEMYGEPFLIPRPDALILVSWFEGGEVFRSGCAWERGAGRIFYFRPGHEAYPIYHHPPVLRVIVNAVRWVRPRGSFPLAGCPTVPAPLEPIRSDAGAFGRAGIAGQT